MVDWLIMLFVVFLVFLVFLFFLSYLIPPYLTSLVLFSRFLLLSSPSASLWIAANLPDQAAKLSRYMITYLAKVPKYLLTRCLSSPLFRAPFRSVVLLFPWLFSSANPDRAAGKASGTWVRCLAMLQATRSEYSGTACPAGELPTKNHSRMPLGHY